MENANARSLFNKLRPCLVYNRLPQQQYDLPKTPLMLALSDYNSKTSSVTPIFNCRVVISMLRRNLWQSFKAICRLGSEPP